MTNIFGMGNAYNIRFAQRSIVRPQVRPSYPAPPPRVNCHCTAPRTVTVGPRGFFGFMTGFLPSFMMGIGIVGMFKSLIGLFRKPKVVTTHYAGGIYSNTSIYNGGNAKQTSNLQTIASKKGMTVLDNGNGTYTLFDSNNNLVKGAKNIGYDKMIDIIGETQGSAKAGTTEDGKASTSAEPPAKTTTETAATTGKDIPTAATEQAISEQATPVATETSTAATTPANTPTANASEDAAEAASVATPETEQPVKTKPTGSKYRKGQNLNGWYRIKQDGEGNAIQDLVTKKGQVSAKDVINTILKSKMDYLSKEDREDIVKQMIANNPSVFDVNGNAYKTAKWDKLDIPSSEALTKKYVKNTSYNKRTGAVKYTNNNGQNFETKSAITDKKNHIVRGNNGYSVEYVKGGTLIFRDNNGRQIAEKEFAKTCKNMYGSAKAWQAKQFQTARDKNKTIIENGAD